MLTNNFSVLLKGTQNFPSGFMDMRNFKWSFHHLYFSDFSTFSYFRKMFINNISLISSSSLTSDHDFRPVLDFWRVFSLWTCVTTMIRPCSSQGRLDHLTMILNLFYKIFIRESHGANLQNGEHSLFVSFFQVQMRYVMN